MELPLVPPSSPVAPGSGPGQALTLAVVSGKGGVGKSLTAVNLAETFAADGRRTALLDADLGQSAGPVLLNEAPAHTVASGALAGLAMDAAWHTTSSGVTLVQAARTPEEADALGPALFAALDAALDALRATHDVVLVDAPAGAGDTVRWALARAGAGLLVLVGEPTAVADAYALAKLVWGAAPGLPLGLVVNAADTDDEAAGVAERFGAVTGRFLGRTPAYLGWVPYAVALRQSVRTQRPAVRDDGATRRAFAGLAAAVAPGPQAWTPLAPQPAAND